MEKSLFFEKFSFLFFEVNMVFCLPEMVMMYLRETFEELDATAQGKRHVPRFLLCFPQLHS